MKVRCIDDSESGGLLMEGEEYDATVDGRDYWIDGEPWHPGRFEPVAEFPSATFVSVWNSIPNDGGGIERKATNPKDACGIAKVPFSTVSAPVIAELGLAMLEGALKYGRHNYRVSGVRVSVYYDAALRHLAAFWEGQDIDPDSGLPHIVKAMACLAVLRDSQMQSNCVDDRPPRLPGHETWISELNAKAKALLEKYPEPKAAHTAVTP